MGHRLAPKLPFVVGGEYSIANLTLTRDSDLICFGAQVANQIARLADGAEIQISISDGES